MALPVVAGCYRVSLTMQSGSAWTATNVFNVRATSADTLQIAKDVGGAFFADNSLSELVSTSFTLVDIGVQAYDGITGQDLYTQSDLALSNTTGWTASAVVSPACAGVVTWRTGVATRSGRGRTYVAGLAQSRVDEASGVIDAGSQTAWQTGASNFWVNVAAGTETTNLVVLSLTELVARNVTSSAARSPLATQRRRQDRVRQG